ncbi:MAG: oxaloacetate decarboxylase [Rhodospirillales bacterium]
MTAGPAARLRAKLNKKELVVAPGVSDALLARLVVSTGFEAVYMTGNGTSAQRLGMPDIGLLTESEMVENAQHIAEASNLPVIADADTGYGGPMNVRRTIRDYERAGVAGVHIEDQQWPKRCGHYAGKTLIPVEEMAGKIKAAVDAKLDPDFVVIARTDALAVEGFEAALERGKAYEAAGADVVFIEAPTERAQIARVPKIFKVPCLFNMSTSGKTPALSVDELQAMGYGIVIYPNHVLMAAMKTAQTFLKDLKSTGTVAGMEDRLLSWEDRHEILGMPEVQELEARYGVSDAARVGTK